MGEWTWVPAGRVTRQANEVVRLEPGVTYRTMGVRWYGKGAYDRGEASTKTVKAARLFRARQGQFVFNRIDTHKGAFDVVSADLDGALATNEFPLYEASSDLDANFLLLYFQQQSVLERIDQSRAGSEGRSRWKEADFEAWRIPLPPLAEQRRIVDVMAAVDTQIEALEAEAVTARQALRLRRSVLFERPGENRTPVRHAFDVLMGRQRAPQHADGPHMTRYVRSANVLDNSLDLTDIKTMNFTPVEQVKFGLKPGDVLVSEGSASAAAVGQCAVWRGEIDGVVCFQKTLLRLSAAARNCPETATKLPAGGHENCPLTVMGSARHDVVCLAAVRG